MDARLHVLEGPDKGQQFPLTQTETLLGRATRAQARLTSPEVSVEHAVIRREGEEFVIENLSAQGTQVNDAKVAGRVKLHVRDRIRLTPDTVLRLESSDVAGLLSRPRLLAGLVGTLLLVLLLVVVLDPFGGASRPPQWNRAYAAVLEWTQAQAAAGTLPPEAVELLRDGWRLDKAGDYKASQQRWWRLQMLLDDPNFKRYRFAEADEAHPQALNALLFPRSGQADTSSDEQAAAALRQLARRRYQAAVSQGGQARVQP